MAAKPTNTARWAQTAGGALSALVVAPTSAEQDTGLTPAQKWTAQKANWWLNIIYTWVLYLSDAVFVSTTGSGLAGLDATGDGASPGVKATPGGGVTPARGALWLFPQVAPTAPANGDHWVTTVTAFARIAGATLTFVFQELAQTFTALQTFNAGLAATGAPAVALTASGGGAPTRGPLNLALQVAPSAPVNGDLWVSSADNQLHYQATASKTVAALNALQTFTQEQTLTRATVNGGVTAGSGLKHVRLAVGPLVPGRSTIVHTWAAAFADANYTVQAAVEIVRVGGSLWVQGVSAHTATQVSIDIQNDNAGNLSGTLHIFAIHD